LKLVCLGGGNADLSTTLRSGRDEKLGDYETGAPVEMKTFVQG
jgi:hypothetical protein